MSLHAGRPPGAGGLPKNPAPDPDPDLTFLRLLPVQIIPRTSTALTPDYENAILPSHHCIIFLPDCTRGLASVPRSQS